MSKKTPPKTPADVRRLILDDRREDESRLGQSRRLDIPESSLRKVEGSGVLPPNQTLRRAFLKAFGVRS